MNECEISTEVPSPADSLAEENGDADQVGKSEGILRPLLIAYIHLRAGTLPATKVLLKEFIAGYAVREGFQLGRVFVGVEDRSELLTVRDLVSEIDQHDVTAVLVAGHSAHALRVLHQMTRIRVIPLSEAAQAVARGSTR